MPLGNTRRRTPEVAHRLCVGGMLSSIRTSTSHHFLCASLSHASFVKLNSND